MSPDTPRTLARRQLAATFAAAGIDSADIDARLLVCAAAGIDHVSLIRDPDVPLGGAASTLAGYAARRLRHEPVSRIIGQREFWGLPFTIGPTVLDPRPETEGLVGSVLDAVGFRRDRALAILDLGTGSGAILAALLRELPHATGIGIDRSLDACRIARGNFWSLGVADRATLICGNWAECLGARPRPERFDIVVSNPPYITTSDLAALDRDVRDYDPAQALDGGEDGLDAYRAIVPCLDDLLRADGVVAFECGAGQGARIAEMLREAGFASPAVYLDLAGHDRVVICLNSS